MSQQKKWSESETGEELESLSHLSVILSPAHSVTKVSQHSFHSVPTSEPCLKHLLLHYRLSNHQSQKRSVRSEQMNETILLCLTKAPKLKCQYSPRGSQSRLLPVNLSAELRHTESLRVGATSSVQWRTMHVCRSAAKRKQSGDTERSSHQAAAHMGQGEEGGGRVSYRIVYSEFGFDRGRDLSRSLPPLQKRKVSLSTDSLVGFKIKSLCSGLPLLVHSPFPLLSRCSPLLFLHKHTCSVSLSSLLFSCE